MKFVGRKIFILLMQLVLSATVVFGQVPLSDPDFTNFLQLNYPSVINGSMQLDTNASKSITGNFICDHQKNISNVNGVQYFDNITTLSLQGDSLTSLPDLSRLTSLKNLFVDTNYLATLPDLSKLTNLQFFIARENRLTTLPSLSSLTQVNKLYVDNNQLTALPDLSKLTLLRIFLCSDNQLTTLPDLSNLISLQAFMCERNKLTSIPSLTNSASLNTLHFQSNQITVFPDLTGLSGMKIIMGQSNFLDSIPDLSAFPILNTVQLQDNKLTFEDLIPSSDHPNFSSFVFMPQKKVGVAKSIHLIETDTLIIDLNIDDTVTSNVYTWYKNGQPLTTTSVNQLVINNLSVNDAGIYTCIITNKIPQLSAISLSSYDYIVDVSPCINFNNFSFSVVDNNCQFPIQINADTNTLTGINKPFTYSLRNVLDNSSVNFAKPPFYVSKVGSYELTVKNANNCQAKKLMNITRNEMCDPVFYPDGDGILDSYYIDLKGNAKIFNIEGDLVNEMTVPAYWNGNTKNGNEAPSGLYMIVVNGNSTIKVTLIR